MEKCKSYQEALHACVCAKSLQPCLTFCDPMDCSPAGSSVYEILQAKILEWVVMPSSRGSSQTRDQTQVSHIAGRFQQCLIIICISLSLIVRSPFFISDFIAFHLPFFMVNSPKYLSTLIFIKDQLCCLDLLYYSLFDLSLHCFLLFTSSSDYGLVSAFSSFFKVRCQVFDLTSSFLLQVFKAVIVSGILIQPTISVQISIYPQNSVSICFK